MSEHEIQNEIRNDLAGKGLFFRANTGRAWTSNECVRLTNGDMLLKNPRPFNTGLPPGFSDLFGLVPVTITAEMVGQKLAVFVGMEVKQPGKKPSDKQQSFLAAVQANGGRADVVTCVAEARKLIEFKVSPVY